MPRMNNKRISLTSMLLLTSISALSVVGCDRTEPDESVKDNTVEVTETEPLTAGESVGESNLDTMEDVDTTTESTSNVDEILAKQNTESSTDSKVSYNQPSIVTSEVSTIEVGTPEATLEQALNTIYYGDAADAAKYYKTDIDNFEEQLEQTQIFFQKTVKQVTITDVEYNADKTKATLKGNISLLASDTPDDAQFELQKIDGVWKIIG